ncbi:MAG TPA: prepilin-type N-terminal cleavage/methylation domain-containing protein [Smithella sp.]|nr:prepilin-type N-terminal cleavage/methylation domain-containing protein [Smithella sp.]HRS96971.1 prepilin-type N-terminal cleavage/methylation domain-containing protein [Smithella sp.]
MRGLQKGRQKKLSKVTGNDFGVTLFELLVAIIVLTILASIAFSVYINYVNKARVTLAVSLLENTRKNLNSYNLEKGQYPSTINFSNCSDENGNAVFDPTFCERFREDIASVENYASNNQAYTLSVRAKDPKKTLVTLENDKISIQDH